MASVTINPAKPSKFPTRVKFRWRERCSCRGQDATCPCMKSKPFGMMDRGHTTEVYSRADIDVLRAAIVRAVETEGTWTPPTAAPVVEVASFDSACAAWAKMKGDQRGAKGTTLEVYASGFNLLFKAIRAVRKIPPDKPVPIDLLSRDLCTDLLGHLRREEYSSVRIYDVSRWLWSVWDWAARDATKWVGVPVPVPHKDDIVAPPPVRRTPPAAPTWVEMDAIVRRGSAITNCQGADGATVWRDRLAIHRYTGLRQSQVLAINARDIREADGLLWLTVAVGKTDEEEAEAREIPLAPELTTLLRPRIEGARTREGGWLFPSPQDPMRARGRDTDSLKQVFEAATDAGEIRRAVWDPPTRKARTSHAFRSAILGELRAQKVEQGMRLAYVGHSEGTTEVAAYVNLSEHYAKDWATMVRAMRPIDWTGPQAPKNVVKIAAR